MFLVQIFVLVKRSTYAISGGLKSVRISFGTPLPNISENLGDRENAPSSRELREEHFGAGEAGFSPVDLGFFRKTVPCTPAAAWTCLRRGACVSRRRASSVALGSMPKAGLLVDPGAREP